MKSFTFFGLLGLLCVQTTVALTSSALRNTLFQNYDKLSHPDGQTEVSMRMTVIDMDFCAHKQAFQIRGWLHMVWKDPRLSWDTWSGVDKLRVPHKMVWRPDIVTYSSKKAVEMNWPTYEELNVIIFQSGKVVFVTPVTLTSNCDFNYIGYPFSEQNCTIKLGSWTHDKSIIKLVPMTRAGKTSMVNIDDFTNKQIEVMETSHVLVDKEYECCPDETYTHAELNFRFKRVAKFMNHQLVTKETFAKLAKKAHAGPVCCPGSSEESEEKEDDENKEKKNSGEGGEDEDGEDGGEEVDN